VTVDSLYTPRIKPRTVTGGTYTLVVELGRARTIEVGALGEHRFPAGWYAYTGSAFGPGGFARVDRHYELAAGERSTRHWHIDYFLGDEAASIRGDVRTPDADIECAVASDLPSAPIDGFGASDCSCSSHLAHATDGAALREAVSTAHRGAGGE
jgi:endonuclease-3